LHLSHPGLISVFNGFFGPHAVRIKVKKETKFYEKHAKADLQCAINNNFE
jgi:hypothetical protein